ncbi:hypothetical protein HPB47_025789 [Ixodes persulcatus]|uniref:Uncharacterized protein n=1 Tax=Ixodes persulcatus TaxID=34615 RepID=A0AC60Q250_IXOPE|nr:hypothetical protein HPB47_025789 [Ixodes persulcatus]
MEVMMGHHSYFEFTTHVENLLFKGLTSSSLGGLLGLCLGVAAFSVLYESITASRHYLVEVQKQTPQSTWEPRSERSRLECAPGESQVDLLYGTMDAHRWTRQTLLHGLQVTMGFFIMLIIMRYNGWIAITVLVASGLAHYCLGLLLLGKPLGMPSSVPR